MAANEKDKQIIQNLKDAGCSDETIVLFFKSDNEKYRMDVLINYRKDLLSKVHNRERELDCLDYLIFKIRKGEL